MKSVVEEMKRGIACIRAVRLECRGPTLGHASHKNGSRRAAHANLSAHERGNPDVDGTQARAILK